MDQVKAYLRILMKHHFWLLVAAAAIFGIVCWWMGANSLAADTKKNTDKVKGSWTALESVVTKGKPANQNFAIEVGKLHADLKKEVMDQWQKRYDEQQQLFHWPEVVADIAKVKPSEPIDPNLCLRYKNLVFNSEPDKGRALEKLYERADYNRPKEIADAPPAGAEASAAADPRGNPVEAAAQPAGAHVEEEGLVVWDPDHRANLERRYNFNLLSGTPSTLNVRLAQEDLWVLEQLADIVRRSNDGASDILAATVKKIESLEIAQWAVGAAQLDKPKVQIAEAKGDQGGGTSMGGMGGRDAGTGDAEPKDLSPEEIEKKRDEELMDGRYLNDQGQPLGATEPAPFAEFKLLFVRMKLVVDQRRISELLYHCVTAPLPMELRLVRMDRPLMDPLGGGATGIAASQTTTTPNFIEGHSKAFTGSSMGRLGQGSAGTTAPPSYRADAAGDPTIGPFDVWVEICGVVQIYNPPDQEKLASGSATDAGKKLPGMPTNPVKLPPVRGGGSMQPGGMRGMGGIK